MVTNTLVTLAEIKGVVMECILVVNKRVDLAMKVFGLMTRNMVLECIDFQIRINMKACGMRI